MCTFCFTCCSTVFLLHHLITSSQVLHQPQAVLRKWRRLKEQNQRQNQPQDNDALTGDRGAAGATGEGRQPHQVNQVYVRRQWQWKRQRLQEPEESGNQWLQVVQLSLVVRRSEALGKRELVSSTFPEEHSSLPSTTVCPGHSPPITPHHPFHLLIHQPRAASDAYK